MAIEAVKKYLSSGVKTPFFLVVGDEQYSGVKIEMSELGLKFVNISDYCDGEDKQPNIDRLIEQLKTADTNKKLAVIGLGEYLALRGNKEASSVLADLKDYSFGGVKVILLLRGVTTQVSALRDDLRFDNRRFSFSDNTGCDISVTLAAPSIGLLALSGIKALLVKLENGIYGNVVVNTKVNLDSALFTVHKIPNAYEGVKFTAHSFDLPRTCGNDEQWAKLLSELNQNSSSLTAVLKQYGYDDGLEADFYARIAGVEYRNWLYFIALKIKAAALVNSYLRFVLEQTERFEDFKPNVLNAIIDVSHTDKQFTVFYAKRKVLVEKFPESDIADFVVNNRKIDSESIYKLTDGTKTEREEIIAWVSRNSVITQIADIYPALTAYLKQYVFKCGELSALLTDYFEAYKRQKVSNRLESKFLEKVDELAKSRKYNQLSTRNVIIESLDKADTHLFWLDALGVEYLAFIAELVHNRGLSLSVKIARAELPTITSINRGFFDDWQSDRKEKSDELDNTKHNDAGGYNFKNNELPIHLAKELDIITKVIDKAATGLALRHYKRFLIVSDHGASRLAVLRKKEEKYETDTKGEHSGRCCKVFNPYDLPFAAEENGYLVLADYGRFKGSRAANVEVHGGASLEEVVVPIIELTLKNGNIKVELVESTVTVDYRTGTEITLFSNSPLKNPSIVFDGKENSKRYPVDKIDDNRYTVRLPDIKRAGKYSASVYEGDDLIGKILIEAQGKSGKINDAFDDLF
jgi:hypothetical protein